MVVECLEQGRVLIFLVLCRIVHDGAGFWDPSHTSKCRAVVGACGRILHDPAHVVE